MPNRALASSWGGGLRFSDASRRVMVELNARGMLAHAEGDYQEWGVGASVMVRPNASGQGMTMNLRSSFGDMASGVDALWKPTQFRGHGPR